MATETIDLGLFFEQADLSPETVDRFADATHVSFNARERFENLLRDYRQRVDQNQGEPLRLGLGLLILGHYGEALEYFGRAPDSRDRRFHAAQAAAALNRYDAAIEDYRQAARHGWDALNADMRIAGLHVRAGELPAARKLLDKHDQAGRDRAEWHFASGLVQEAQTQKVAALEAFERAMTLDPDHAEAMFRAARLYDQLGDDQKALELYHRLTLQPRAHINALLNAAVIYEDIGRFEEAAECTRRVLRAFPNHTRGRLYLKDIESSLRMVIDEGGEQRVDLRQRLLETPITEFELSVRARNCLKKMNIRTLGDLIRLSEAELLAYKNFGETSLSEIKSLLGKKGLHLGMNPEEVDPNALPTDVVAPAKPKGPTLPPGQEQVLAKPVSELELSVRARRCLQRLNVQSLGELVQYTEADLLATRNFGVTSLTEIKNRLAEHNLQLAPKKQA